MCWNFVLDATPVIARPLHIDGISVYSLNVKGLVRRHDVEIIIVNGTPVKPPFAKAWVNLPSWVSQGLNGGAAAPGLTTSSGGVVGAAAAAALMVGRGRGEGGGARELHWKSQAFSVPLVSPVARQSHSAMRGPGMVTAMQTSDWETNMGVNGGVYRAASEGLGTPGGAGGVEEGGSENREGLPPMGGGDEGDQTSSKDKKDENGDAENKKAPPPKKQKKKKKGFWPIEIDGPLGCETSWDCTGGYVCCDLILVKICCSNGVMQRKPGDIIPVLLPIPGRGRTELDQ